MLMRNWLTNQMLLLRHLQLQPATPTTPRRLRCHAAQQHKRHHYESFAPVGLCHHLQSTRAVNLSLSQLQKQTGQWEISKIPESPFGTVNSELSASDPMLLAGEVWPSPPENLRSRRLHWSVSHQTHNKGGLQRISVHTIQNYKTSFHRNHLKPKRTMRHEDRPLVSPLLQVTIVDMWSGGNQTWVPDSTQTKQPELDGVQTVTYETRVGPPRGICWSTAVARKRKTA